MAKIIPNDRPFMYLRDKVYTCEDKTVMMEGTEEVVRTELVPSGRFSRTFRYWRCPVCGGDHCFDGKEGRDQILVGTFGK